MKSITKSVALLTAFCLFAGQLTLPELQAAENISIINLPMSVPFFSGIKIYPQEPFRFDFLVDGDWGMVDKDVIHQPPSTNPEYLKLVKYFMASLTVPEGDLWVNLSPYEPDRIVPEALGQTEMGRDLLAQDYILKQLTASLMNPEAEEGKKFWERVYEKVYKELSSPNVSVGDPSLKNGFPTTERSPRYEGTKAFGNDSLDNAIESFNKVWIIPNKVEVYQNNDVAYITHANFKVMLESDYLAQEKAVSLRGGAEAIPDKMTQHTKNIIRSTIIPLIEEEVNQGESFFITGFFRINGIGFRDFS